MKKRPYNNRVSTVVTVVFLIVYFSALLYTCNNAFYTQTCNFIDNPTPTLSLYFSILGFGTGVLLIKDTLKKKVRN